MDKEQICALANRPIDYRDMQKAVSLLSRDYEIQAGKLTSESIKAAIDEGNPVIVKGKLIKGYDPGPVFVDTNDETVKVDEPAEAIVITEERPAKDFAIIDKVEWEDPIDLMPLKRLKLGAIYLPKHSAVFNFLNPTEKTKEEHIVSVLNGININIYERDNYIDNCLHEIGHLFWRTCLTFDEKMLFKEFFDHLRPSAIYEYKWETHNEQEVFCTIYKWYLKSVLINESYYNILEYEEPRGLKLFQDVLERIAKARLIDDIWEMAEGEVREYFNPKLDRTTGKFIRNKDMLDRIKDVELPEKVMLNVKHVREGLPYVQFGKAVVPVKDGMIDFRNIEIEKQKVISFEKRNGRHYTLNKAKDKSIRIFLDMDGVLADFIKGYEQIFGEKIDYDTDHFIINQRCLTQPHFFRMLPVIERGKQLFDALRKKYENVVILTTPMKDMEYCKTDKITWLKQNIADDLTVEFSNNKAEYAQSSLDFLIDDMDYNLKPWAAAGGTAIDFKKMSNEEIMQKIEDTINPVNEIREIKEQLKNMQVDPEPSEKQKESGNYKKGDVVIRGMRIRIENIPGSIRFGFGENGKKWVNRMKNYYGYISGTEGNDNDPIDVFIGKNHNTNKCFVVNQLKNGLFDEHKIIMSVNDLEEAKQTYLQNYEKGWERNIHSIVPTNTKLLREWLKSGNKFEPYE